MIREATPEDLSLLEPLARQFYAESRFLDGFSGERFEAIWRELMASGRGVIFLLLDGGQVAGGLGGVMYPEPYSGAGVATEFFWYVGAGHRGSGMKLYWAFEEWARRKGCSQIRMVHLTDSMPEQLSRVYGRLGFEAAETHYVKALSKGAVA